MGAVALSITVDISPYHKLRLFPLLTPLVLVYHPEMQFRYQLSQRDFYDSIIAIRNRKAWAKWFFQILPIFLVVLIVYASLATPHSQLVSNMTPVLILFLLWASMLWVSPWLSAGKQFQQRPAAQGDHSVEFGENEIHWTWSSGASVVEWKNYVYWMETKNQLLLCSSPVTCSIIPKRALKPEEQESLRALLTEKLGVGRRV